MLDSDEDTSVVMVPEAASDMKSEESQNLAEALPYLTLAMLLERAGLPGVMLILFANSPVDICWISTLQN